MKKLNTSNLLIMYLLIFASIGCNNNQNKQTEINSSSDSDEENEMWIDSTYKNVEGLNIKEGNFNLEEEDGWIDFETEEIDRIRISKTEDFTFKELRFKAIWDDKLTLSDNIGYYGGIKHLKIYLNNQLVNVFDSIEDADALGEIVITIYDYNFDGNLDFSYKRESGATASYSNYCLYNPSSDKFEVIENWSLLRIQKINKRTKEILAQPDWRYGRVFYKINGLELIKVAKEKDNL
ncbi:MAG: hypothetical protein KFKLKKLM_00840 [Flavobacteriales bacterium]|nr:hypothetical protein [Flavobacteriales bacterium]